ncbi:MAG: DUF1018 domain-containing protein [Candidatus Omnitrophota bacterium]|jgi:hypothetical protein|nr:MAG: DUF1018 domain-containing protein [Candidatus Omnitrophota bacterium]
MSPIDSKKLAVIHIVKKEIGLSDEEYREILEGVAGVTSAKDLDEAAFRRLMNYFVRSRHYQVNKFGLTVKQKLYIEHLAYEQLGWSKQHLINFMQKYYHKSNLNFLPKKEANHLIYSLKAIIEHENKGLSYS